ncbi:hypothetical protein [Actinoplanes sp. ATCC 53533]|uniref:hypothetical protein n=1 Tax=Actinoplanes sp. ATCC 53533 TaxID=1288362 RepID=UPI000F7994F2|nr:hypothetical protein [Actinoplanes sp. ATCC 53533]
MKDDRDVVRAYGTAFDSLVGEVANAMTASAHPPGMPGRPGISQIGPNWDGVREWERPLRPPG